MVVIAILGILSSALVVSVKSGYKQARQTNCKSNLQQFGVALTILPRRTRQQHAGLALKPLSEYIGPVDVRLPGRQQRRTRPAQA